MQLKHQGANLCYAFLMATFILFAASRVVAVEYEYTEQPDAVTITKYVGTALDIVIPDSIAGKPVTAIQFSAFSGRADLKSIVVSDNVQSVGRFACQDCTSLISIHIGKGVTKIGYGCVNGCVNLSAITVDSDNIYFKISDGVLFNNDLTQLLSCPAKRSGVYTIPNTVSRIGLYAFVDCSRISEIKIPTSVKDISGGAFYGCSGLSFITIPDSVNRILGGSFANCTGLISFTIPNSVVGDIGQGTFAGDTKLKSIIIGSGVTVIGDGAFSACAQLTNIVIGANVKSIGYGAFQGCAELTTVTIPDSVISLGDSAFFDLGKLQYVQLGQGLESINSNLFYNCTNLASLVCGRSLKTIKGSAFANCNSLASVTFEGDSPMVPGGVDGYRLLFEYSKKAIIYYYDGSFGWGPAFAGRPTFALVQLTLSLPQLDQLNNTLQFYVNGVNGKSFVIEQSSSLNDGWSGITTNYSGVDVFTYKLELRKDALISFYRVRRR